MATLSEGEILLKEQIELQKGLNLTISQFKRMTDNSKQYQQMLRAINRELLEHNSIYGTIRERNEEIFDSVSNYTNYLKKNNLTNNFNGIYKSVNKIVDEFKDLNAKLQTGDISIKEYEKSFARLSSTQKAIEREKIYLTDILKDKTEEEYKLSKQRLDDKFNNFVRVGRKYKAQVDKELKDETKRRENLDKEVRKSGDAYDANPTAKNQKRLDDDIGKWNISQKKVTKLEFEATIAPSESEMNRLQKDFNEKELFKDSNKHLLESLEESTKLTQHLTDEFSKTKGEVEFIDKRIGNIGRTMGVLQHFGLNKIFDFEAVENAMQAAAREEYALEEQRKRGVDVTIKKFGVLKAGVGAIGKELSEKFLNVGIIGGGLWLGKQILDLMFQFDERWREISKNQAMNRQDSQQLLNVYQAMTGENKKIAVYGTEIRQTAASQKELLEATHTLTTGLGLNYTIINKQEGDLLANMKERMGLSDEMRQTMLENSYLANQSLDEYFDTSLGVNAVNRATNKFYVNDKALLGDISKASAAIRLQFKNHSSDLAQIVINSKQYGLNIQQLEESMNGMLDWEKQNELQASFFAQTGQMIDTSRLQIYAQTNQLEKYQEEFRQLAGTSDDFNKLNRIAQETKANLFGFQRESFAQMLLEEEVNDKIYKDETAKQQMLARQTEISMRKEIDMYREKGLANEEIFKIMGKQSEMLLSQIKSSDEFGRAIDKIKDTFASFVENEDIEKLIQSFSNLISGANEFLMEHGNLLGIRTPENIKKKYESNGESMGGGLYDLQRNLNSVSKVKGRFNFLDIDNTAKIKESERDLEYLIDLYIKEYKIDKTYKKNFSDFIKESVKTSNSKDLLDVSPDVFMKKGFDKFKKHNEENKEPFFGYEDYFNKLGRPNVKKEEYEAVYDYISQRIKAKDDSLHRKGKYGIGFNLKSSEWDTVERSFTDDYFKNKKVNDSLISPKGRVVISTPEGKITPNPKDYLITTTNPENLMQKDVVMNQFTLSETKIVDTLSLVQKEIARSTEAIVRAVLANKDVNLNYRKISENINLNNSRI